MNLETTFIDKKYNLWYLIDLVESKSLITGKVQSYVFIENKEGKQKQILLSTLKKDYKQIVCPHYVDFIQSLNQQLFVETALERTD